MAEWGTPAGVAIRDANLADMDRIVEIEDGSFTDPYPRGLLKAFLYMPGAYLVASEGGRVVGYTIGIIRHKTIGHLVSVAVSKESRRRGIAEALIGQTLKRLAEEGAESFMLEVRESNDAAKRLYSKMGFVEVGKMKKYYADGESAIVMEINGNSGSQT